MAHNHDIEAVCCKGALCKCGHLCGMHLGEASGRCFEGRCPCKEFAEDKVLEAAKKRPMVQLRLWGDDDGLR